MNPTIDAIVLSLTLLIFIASWMVKLFITAQIDPYDEDTQTMLEEGKESGDVGPCGCPRCNSDLNKLEGLGLKKKPDSSGSF